MGAVSSFPRMQGMLYRMGFSQEKMHFVHVAGTNGKGSVCALLDSVLRRAGYKTGLFTSPYIHRFSERIRVDGKCITDEELCQITEKLVPIVDSLSSPPTEFEIVTVIGLCHFQNKKCSVVVLETGLGGRLDPTNIISSPLCCVITNIGLDHTAILGDTIEKIAGEKAGIIKNGVPIVAYPSGSEALAVIRKYCADKDAKLILADFENLEPIEEDFKGQSFCYRGETYCLSLLGLYQQKNAAVALEALEVLSKTLPKISKKAIRDGLAQASHMARFELADKNPPFIIDGGHNAQCAKALCESMSRYFPNQKVITIIGMMKDKSAEDFVKAISPFTAHFVCVKPQNPRAMPAEDLAEIAARNGFRAQTCDTINGAIKSAKSLAMGSQIICATGSLYLAGEVRQSLIEERANIK